MPAVFPAVLPFSIRLTDNPDVRHAFEVASSHDLEAGAWRTCGACTLREGNGRIRTGDMPCQSTRVSIHLSYIPV